MVTNCSVILTEESVTFPFCTPGRVVSVSGRQTSSGIAGGKTRLPANECQSFSDGENCSLSTACWLLAREQAREKTGLWIRGELMCLLKVWWSRSTSERILQRGLSICCRWKNGGTVWHPDPLQTWNRSRKLKPSTVWGYRCSVRKSKLTVDWRREALGKERW